VPLSFFCCESAHQKGAVLTCPRFAGGAAGADPSADGSANQGSSVRRLTDTLKADLKVGAWFPACAGMTMTVAARRGAGRAGPSRRWKCRRAEGRVLRHALALKGPKVNSRGCNPRKRIGIESSRRTLKGSIRGQRVRPFQGRDNRIVAREGSVGFTHGYLYCSPSGNVAAWPLLPLFVVAPAQAGVHSAMDSRPRQRGG